MTAVIYNLFRRTPVKKLIELKDACRKSGFFLYHFKETWRGDFPDTATNLLHDDCRCLLLFALSTIVEDLAFDNDANMKRLATIVRDSIIDQNFNGPENSVVGQMTKLFQAKGFDTAIAIFLAGKTIDRSDIIHMHEISNYNINIFPADNNDDNVLRYAEITSMWPVDGAIYPPPDGEAWLPNIRTRWGEIMQAEGHRGGGMFHKRLVDFVPNTVRWYQDHHSDHVLPLIHAFLAIMTVAIDYGYARHTPDHNVCVHAYRLTMFVTRVMAGTQKRQDNQLMLMLTGKNNITLLDVLLCYTQNTPLNQLFL